MLHAHVKDDKEGKRDKNEQNWAIILPGRVLKYSRGEMGRKREKLNNLGLFMMGL